MLTSDPQIQQSPAEPKSIWKHGAIGAALLALLAEVNILFFTHEAYAHETKFILMNLFAGTPLNFVLYWPSFTLIAWVWRRLGNLSWILKILVIALSLAGILIVFRLFVEEGTVIYQIPFGGGP